MSCGQKAPDVTTLDSRILTVDSLVAYLANNGVAVVTIGDSAQILSGAGIPPDSIGVSGSLYIRNDNDTVLYVKEGSSWNFITSD